MKIELLHITDIGGRFFRLAPTHDPVQVAGVFLSLEDDARASKFRGMLAEWTSGLGTGTAQRTQNAHLSVADASIQISNSRWLAVIAQSMQNPLPTQSIVQASAPAACDTAYIFSFQ
jgi:hypothetical protein